MRKHSQYLRNQRVGILHLIINGVFQHRRQFTDRRSRIVGCQSQYRLVGWSLAAWGRNLTDEDAVTYGYTNFLGDRSYSLQMPISYGVNFIYRWE